MKTGAIVLPLLFLFLKCNLDCCYRPEAVRHNIPKASKEIPWHSTAYSQLRMGWHPGQLTELLNDRRRWAPVLQVQRRTNFEGSDEEVRQAKHGVGLVYRHPITSLARGCRVCAAHESDSAIPCWDSRRLRSGRR